jgi:flagellar basal body-associated protein FliL
MMKFILPLLSFLIGNAKGFIKEPAEAFSQQLAMRVRSLTTLLVSVIGSLALGCVGLSLFIASIASQLDKNEEFHVSGGMMVFLGLTVVSIGVLVYSLSSKTWMKSLGFEEKPPQAPSAGSKRSGALENAVALLVMDYIDERKSRRDEKHQQP